MSAGPGEPASVLGPKVFITYRREETAAHAGRLYDAMVARFGEANVFMDVEMAPGVDFVERITEVVGACQVLIVVMGPRWATVEDEQGAPRLANPEDFVRLEVETALRRPDVTPIPVLVAGARMPDREDLPSELRAITRRNALELSDLRWRYDVGRLMTTLDELLAGEPAPPDAAETPRHTAVAAPPASGRRLPWVPVGGALAIVAIVVAVVVAASGGGGGNKAEDQVAGVIETSFTTTDPADCRKLYTQRFLERQFGGTGQDAVKACADDTRFTGDDPNSVDVTDVRVSGDSATSKTAVNGGIFDGQTLVFSSRREDDQWKIDRLTDIKDFDLERFANAFATTSPNFRNPLTPKQADCAKKGLIAESPASVKAGILANNPEQVLPFHKDCNIEL